MVRVGVGVGVGVAVVVAVVVVVVVVVATAVVVVVGVAVAVAVGVVSTILNVDSVDFFRLVEHNVLAVDGAHGVSGEQPANLMDRNVAHR